ncbi:phage tail protein [Bradyrhizobium semiaridum]|uniref:phage tail protein n=1 Tax=Bradyrhizobium semiaridum TaxID=2821404 RepID=UPI0035E066B9
MSRTTYATLFALMGTTHGAGDGSTTFNLPDRRGRVSAQLDNTGIVLTSARISPDGNTLGAKGGTQSHVLQMTEIPSHTHDNTLADGGHFHDSFKENQARVFGGAQAGSPAFLTFQLNNGDDGAANTGTRTSNITLNNAAAGGGASHNNLQPTIACNYIIRII